MELRKEKKITTFTIVTKRATIAGRYKLKCRLSNTLTVEGPLVFMFYEKAALASLKPDKIQVNKAVNVTVKGTGFQDTGELRCIGTFKDKHRKMQTQYFPAEYESSTTIKCVLPPCKTSRIFGLGVLFSKRQADTSLTKRFVVFENPPKALKAQFSKNRKKVIITFDKNVQPNHRSKSCDTFFKPESLLRFGKTSSCVIRNGNELQVTLSRNANLTSGDRVVLKSRSVKGVSAASERSDGPEETGLGVSQNGNPPQVVASLRGPRVIGLYVL